MKIKIKKIYPNAVLPAYQTEHSAGADLRAYLKEPLKIRSMSRAMIPTGLAMEIPVGYEAQIRPRSGLASKGLMIPNSPGTIDADYRGELRVLLLNLSEEDIEIRNGDRIAQVVIQKVEQVDFVEAQDLSETARGSGGFGHTGVR